MSLDIKEGDTLMVGTKEYPIKSCADWSDWDYGSHGLRRFLKVKASTKRSPSMSSGKRGSSTMQIRSLKCTPLDPVSAEIASRPDLETPHELLQTFADGGDAFYHLILEDIKR